MENDYLVLIGDANGADKSMQAYFAARNYRNVVVFCAGDKCRNNIGSWETRHIRPEQDKKDFTFYATKDLEMAKQADYGFMIWDAQSKGTLHNVISLLRNGKKVLVYFSPDKAFFTLKRVDDVLPILAKCDQTVIDIFKSEINASADDGNKQQALNFG
jgi:hypothetical protein